MTIEIGGYNFEGPYASANSVANRSGVYVILGRNGQNTWNVVDIGESATLQTRLERHDRKDCWARQGFADLQVAVLYCGTADRVRVESGLRIKYNPPCGKR